MRSLLFALLTLPAACSADFHPAPRAAATAATPRAMQAQAIPEGFRISVTNPRTDEAVLHVEYPPSWWLGARVTWFRNGEPYAFPPAATDQTEAEIAEHHRTVITALPPDDLSDPFKEEATVETWTAEAVAKHWPSDATPVRTTVKVTLSRGCEVFHPGWVYVGCRRDAVFSVPLMQPVNLRASSPVLYLEQFIERHFLDRPGTPGHDRFRAFVNLFALSALTTTDVTLVAHDPATYFIDPTFETSADLLTFIHKTCLDIPLVGIACLHGYVTDIDGEPHGLVLDYGPEAMASTDFMPPDATSTSITAASYGDYDVIPLGDDRYEVALRLRNATVDLLFEPPADPDLIDIKNNPDNPAYTPERDLSNYLKGYNRADLGTPLEARFEVTVPSGEFSKLSFTLRTIQLYQVDFNFVFKKGPYCNSNLGTTETPAAGQSYSRNPSDRPFDDSGLPKYPGLVSDTISGVQGDEVLRNFFSRIAFPYPHTESQLNGGSGVGRDRLGVNAKPYEFNPEAGRFSDNPNNCMRPADACWLLAGVDADKLQDGGAEWLGISNASCEWPNISNNGDDATYKLSEQVTSIVPYVQGQITEVLTHQPPR